LLICKTTQVLTPKYKRLASHNKIIWVNIQYPKVDNANNPMYPKVVNIPYPNPPDIYALGQLHKINHNKIPIFTPMIYQSMVKLLLIYSKKT